MHTEIQVALRFVISFLYNKLPRRRVNLFGEELEAALRDKFHSHWYPDKPFKGSAYRCLKITDPADPVLNRAARESGNPVADIIENLPADLAVWIDPGEVSYRMGEKGAVKILYSEKEAANSAALIINNSGEDMSQQEVVGGSRGGSSFLSLDCTLAASLNSLSLSQSGCYAGQAGSGSSNGNNGGASSPLGQVSPPILLPPTAAAAVVSPPAAVPSYNPPGNPFQPRQQPVVYTAATFAQTKFGSTKLKTNSKKPNRMSPTEFSNYIKQRALQKSLQQQQQQQISYGSNTTSNINSSGSNSPGGGGQHQNGFFDKFYGSQSTSSYFQNNGALGGGGSSPHNNSTNNMNNYNIAATTFHKSLSSPGGSSSSHNNDFGLGLPLSSSNQNLLSPSLGTMTTGGGFSLSDYTSLLADWPDNEAETNTILQDLLASATTKQTTREERTTFSSRTWHFFVI